MDLVWEMLLIFTLGDFTFLEGPIINWVCPTVGTN